MRGHLQARRNSGVCEDPKPGWDVVKAGAGLSGAEHAASLGMSSLGMSTWCCECLGKQ